MLYVPGVNAVVLFRVTTVLLPGVTGLTEKLTVVPAGFPLAVRLAGVINPPTELVGRVTAPEVCPQVMLAGVVLSKLNVLGGRLIEKLLLEISKNILLMASTFTLAVVVADGRVGTVMLFRCHHLQ